MCGDIERVLISSEQLAQIADRIAIILASEYHDKNPLILCVLKGAIPFFSDVLRRLDFPCTIDCVRASSYGLGSSGGELEIEMSQKLDVKARHVIVIEDILDTGVTLSQMISRLREKNPLSIKLCVLLDKPARRKVELEPDIVGMEIPNEFVVGYGLDYAEKYRNLPYIGVLKREIYSK